MAAEDIILARQCGKPGCDCLRARVGRGDVHCPAHEDADPSLSVAEKDGTPLVFCHGGCTQSLVIEKLREQGLWLLPSRQNDRSKRRTRGEQKRYEVRDQRGHLIAVHVRTDGPHGKRMWWESPDGSNGLGGVALSALPLYGSETLSSLADRTQVVVTEGEKAADALRSMGIIAVGTVTGAKETPGDDALRPLVRLRPLLWADSDDPGRQHMARIAPRLMNLGTQDIRLVEWPDAPPKGDAADAASVGMDMQTLLADATVWKPGDVDLHQLLDGVAEFLLQYLVVTEHQVWTLALWIAHTHALDAAECTPYLSIKSAEKRSAKTLLLELLNLLVANPWFTGRVTSAVLVRKVAKDAPTLLLDETDAAFKGDKEYSETLRGVLNSGYRRGGTATLCVKVGGNWDIGDFPVFCAKALAGIGRLPDTVQDRSIPIEMRRKARDEQVTRFKRRDAKAESTPLKESLEQWATSAVPILELARPVMPQELDDRATDVWEPLMAIADLAGGDWPQRSWKAALALSAGSAREDDSLGVMLLNDVRKFFMETRADRTSSAALVDALVELEESPWGDLRGKGLDTRRLARMLKPYGFGPRTVRLSDGSTPKGYLLEDFADTWNRYLPAAATSATSATNDEPELSGVADVALVADKSGISRWQI